VVNERLNRIIDNYVLWHKKLNMNRYLLREITLGIMDIIKIVSLIIGIRLIINGNMTLGTITIIYSYYAKLSELFTSIITLSESLNNKKVSLKRINKLFQYANNHVVDNSDYNDIKGIISFKNILYGNKLSPILKDVSFDIKDKSLTILSGSIKGTEGIFDLLLRYNREHSGEILIDNVNIDLYSRENISNNIGFIMEYPTFFNTSIRDNLEIFDSNFENVINVCKYLEIDDQIMKLENGYETIINSDANNIDEDLKYLLAFARVFLKKSRIILINNILEHVSKPIASKLLNLIIELKKEHTIILITRDINIIKNKNVDKIIFIAYKEVIGEGIHKDLIKNNQRYKNLIKQI
jgi:ABC-type bacteriocin/lantibiotic exporter with double-glycine peptidase domain